MRIVCICYTVLTDIIELLECALFGLGDKEENHDESDNVETPVDAWQFSEFNNTQEGKSIRIESECSGRPKGFKNPWERYR